MEPFDIGQVFAVIKAPPCAIGGASKFMGIQITPMMTKMLGGIMTLCLVAFLSGCSKQNGNSGNGSADRSSQQGYQTAPNGNNPSNPNAPNNPSGSADRGNSGAAGRERTRPQDPGAAARVMVRVRARPVALPAAALEARTRELRDPVRPVLLIGVAAAHPVIRQVRGAKARVALAPAGIR